MAADSGVGCSPWQMGNKATESCHRRCVLFEEWGAASSERRSRSGRWLQRHGQWSTGTLDGLDVEATQSCQQAGGVHQRLMQRVGGTARTCKLCAHRALRRTEGGRKAQKAAGQAGEGGRGAGRAVIQPQVPGQRAAAGRGRDPAGAGAVLGLRGRCHKHNVPFLAVSRHVDTSSSAP